MKTTLQINGEPLELEAVQKKPQSVQFTLEGKSYHFLGHRLADGRFVLDEEIAPGQWQRLSGTAFSSDKGAARVRLGAHDAIVSPVVAGAAAAQSALSPTAPMPGLVRQVLVKIGDQVRAGDPLVVMEAMKLQTTLSAGGDGIVEAILVEEGAQVVEGAELVKLSPLKKA